MWAVSTQSRQIHDQDSVLSAASRLFSSDYHDFFRDQYIGSYPNQIGLVFWEYIIFCVVGVRNTIFLQMLNAFFVMIVYKKLSEIGSAFGMSRISQLVVLFLGVMFCPLALYTSFIYGTVPGLAFSLLAIHRLLIYLEKDKWYYVLISVLYWIPAIGVKKNYYIFLIGTLIYFVIELIRKKKYLQLIYPAIIAIVCIVSVYSTKAFLENKLGFPIHEGISPWAYVAMGLTENNDKANGWYDASIKNSFRDSEYDTDLQAEQSKVTVNELYERFKYDHEYRNLFFLKKIVSQWDDPTFQGFWINQTRDNSLVVAKWAKRLRNDSVIHPIRMALDCFMVSIYFGSLLFILLCPDKKKIRYSVFAIIFIGGFLFHLVWEAKAQYTLPYFVLLIPYAVFGYTLSIKKLDGLTNKILYNDEFKQFWKKPGFIISAIFVISGLIFLLSMKYKDLWIDTEDDTKYIKKYLSDEKENLNPLLTDGKYVIKPIGSECVISVGDVPVEDYYSVYISEDRSGNNNSILSLKTFNDKTKIFIMKEQENEDRYLMLESYDPEVSEYRSLRVGKMTGAREQEWRIYKGENGYYTIQQDKDHVITYDPIKKEIYLAPLDETLRQYFDITLIE